MNILYIEGKEKQKVFKENTRPKLKFDFLFYFAFNIIIVVGNNLYINFWLNER